VTPNDGIIISGSIALLHNTPVSHETVSSVPAARPAHGRAHLKLRLTAAGLSLLTVGAAGGCRFVQSEKPEPSPGAAKLAGRPRDAKQSTLPPPDWAKVVEKWWQGAAGPAVKTPQSNSATGQRRRVTINIGAIATRHPAWELARTLERDRNAPVTLTPVAIQALQQASRPESFAVPMVDINLAPGGAPAETEPGTGTRGGGRGRGAGNVAGLDLPERRLIAEELQALQQEVKARQVVALNQFLRDVQVRQDTARTEQAALLQLGLQYDIEAAQRSSLSRLNPILPPDEVQLEMANLQLDLLKNLYTTEAAREVARKRLAVLQAQWDAQLRQQENERLAELRRLMVEIPARVRREGEVQINTYKEAARQRDAAFRQSVEEAQQGRVAQDFAPATARLGIVLPAFSVPSQTIDATEAASSTTPQNLLGGIAPRTGLAPWGLQRLPAVGLREALDSRPARVVGPSANSRITGMAPTTGGGRVQERRAVLIRALRAMALRDAARWSRLVARRRGWSWPEGGVAGASGGREGRQPAAAVQEATGEVLRALKLS